MWVDDGPAVLPARSCGQIIESHHDLSLPLSTVQVSLSQNGGGQPSRHISPGSPLVCRDVLAASCTLAALCLCRVWFCFLATGTASLFYFEGASSRAQFAALLIDNLLLAGLFVAVWRMTAQLRSSRTGQWFSDVAFLLILLIPANAIRGIIQPLPEKLNVQYWRHATVQSFPGSLKFLPLGCTLLLVTLALYFHRHLSRAAYRTLILLFPLVPFLLVEASWVLAHSPGLGSRVSASAGERGASGLPVAARASQRVVWIIFDEMDYRLAFESPARHRLPEFEQLASHSLSAVSAYPPGGRTMISVPALLSGRMVTSSNAVDASDVLVSYEGATSAVRWNTHQTIFDLERQMGWRTAVAGWYLPYSRIFGADIEAWQDQTWRLGLNPHRPFLRLLTDGLRVMAEGRSQSILGRSLTVEEHQRIAREVTTEAARRAANPALDLVFLHLPIPHAPFFYDASTGQESASPRHAPGYLDQLQLADRVLGQIRRAMKEAGVSATSTLVVSSDHWYREGDLIDGHVDHRIPFLVSFPGNSRGVRYSTPFNTVLSRRLVTAILQGEIHSAAETKAWLDCEKGDVGESLYNRN